VNVPIVRTERLSRWYGEVIGLNDVSVEVGPGITGLLGPNGAGKSSFLRVVSGELRPSSGRVEVLGETPFARPAFHRRVGYCPEGDRFFDALGARELLVHLLRLSGYRGSDARRRADAALEEVDLAEAAGVRLAECSKGMRQRVKIAQALAHDPELLLLDEPLSGLDPVARHRVQELIRRRAEAGVSVLVSSHVLHEVEELTTTILLVNKGRIAATGELAEIRDQLDRHPRRIRLECAEARRLASLLVTREDVRSLRLEEEALLIETIDPARFYEDFPALVVDHDLEVTGLTSPDDRLQAVFDFLVD
jgi:ABC-2 type transport system ATP-binding protein